MKKHKKAPFRKLYSSILIILLGLFAVSCAGPIVYEIIAEFVLNPDGESYKLNQYQGEDIDVVIPKTHEGLPVTVIGKSAFLQNHFVETILVSNNIIRIETYAFRDMPKLREITFEENSKLTTIEDGIIEWSDLMTNFTIPASVTSIDSFAFNLAYNLANINVAHENQVYASTDGILFNKDFSSILKYPDGKLGSTYEIPATVTRIGDGSFNIAHNLTSVTFHPSSKVTAIGKRAFMATALQTFVVPNTVLTIEESAFSAMHELTSFTFEQNSQLETLGHLVFENNGLETITLPASLSEIKDDTFSGNYNLVEILVYENNEHFSSESGILFSKVQDKLYNYPEAKELSSYVIPKQVIEIKANAFASVHALINISFAEGTNIEKIGDYAFAGVNNVISFTLPNTVTEIGIGAFSGMTKLKAFVFAENSTLEVISDYMFRYALKLESILIPKSVTTIGDWAFFDTKVLKWVLFEEESALTSIGDFAFIGNSSLETFVIPLGVTTIGESVFLNTNHVLIFAEAAQAAPGWDERWNSGARPVYFGDDWSYGLDGFPVLN